MCFISSWNADFIYIGGVMVVEGYWLFPNSFMFGFSVDEEGLEIFLGIFALSFYKGEDL